MSDISEQHAAAMARDEIQCPACEKGWLKYFVEQDSLQCVLCSYKGGATKPNVGMGVIAHVGLRVNTPDIMAAHDGAYYKLVEKVAKAAPANLNKAIAAEIVEYERVEAAQKKIFDDLKLSAKVLLSMGKLPEMIKPDDDLEIRLLLCHASTTPGTSARSKGIDNASISTGSTGDGEAVAS